MLFKKNHKYYYQIMGQMALTHSKQSYFVAWTSKSEP